MKKFLTMLEIFNSFESEDIIKQLLELYPDQVKNVEGYKGMLTAMRDINPNPEPQTMRIQVYRVIQEWEGTDIETDDYISVHGIDPAGDGGEDVGWAIEYSPWEDFLSWEVECICTDDPRCDSFLKVFCHIIWEMTWAGYDQVEIKAQIDELMAVKDRIEDGTEELFEIKFDENGIMFEESCGDVFEDLGLESPLKDLDKL